MTFQTEDYIEYLEKVNGLKKIDWVQNYLNLKKKPNFWTILEYGEIASANQKSSHEIRYSKMLRWLLDANENHNLGNIFAHELIKKIDDEATYEYHSEKNEHIHANTEALENIDIFYKDLDQRVCLAIELKQYTTEHESTGFDTQLDKYEHVVSQYLDENGQDISVYYIYLTPNKETPTNKNWHAVGYQEIIELITKIDAEKVMNSNNPFKLDMQKIVSDFTEDLQRTLDILNKDTSYIRDHFTKEEKTFTRILANEMSHEVDSSHIDALLELNQGDSQELKELISIIEEFNYTQDHTPNDGVRLLMRKFFNYMAEDVELSLDLGIKYSLKERTAKIKPELIEKYQLAVDEIRLTQDKGQGIFLYHTEKNARIYFSGDKDGIIPNDRMQILNIPSGKIVGTSDNIKNGAFNVEPDFEETNQVIHNMSKSQIEVIPFEKFLDEYLLKEISVLSHRVYDLEILEYKGK